jgi:hypothetical protein
MIYSDCVLHPHVSDTPQAICKSKAWVISGGTNVGVMKKIGEVMRSLTEEKQGFVAPVIGVATWGIVKGRKGLCEGVRWPCSELRCNVVVFFPLKPESLSCSHSLTRHQLCQLDLKARTLKDYEELTEQQIAKRRETRKSMRDSKRWSTIMEASQVGESSKPDTLELPEQNETPYDPHQFDAELDPNHNMFFLVDDGTEAHFGGELQFRAALEKKIHSTYKATVVSVMIQGGPNTIGTSFQALNKGTPLVVIEDSGGAADVIAYAWNFVHSGSLLHTKHTYKGLQEKIAVLTANAKPDGREKMREELSDKVLHIVRVRELVRGLPALSRRLGTGEDFVFL